MIKGIYLTLLIGPVAPLPAPQEVTDALTDVQVTVSGASRSGFQLSFGASKRSIINRDLLPQGYFDPGTRVVIIVTFKGIPTVLMDGIITRQELAPGNEPGQSKLTVTGEDVSLMMDLELKRQNHKALSAHAQVIRICLGYPQYGIFPVAVPPFLTEVPNPVKEIPVQTVTDLNYIQFLASQVGHVFYLEPGPAPLASRAYWGPEIRLSPPQPALTINSDAENNVESLSFSLDGLSNTRFTVNVTIPFTKLAIAVPIPDVGVLRPPLTARPSAPLRTEPIADTSKFSAITAALWALAKTSSAAETVTGSGQLDVLRYGHILQARRLVSVRGAGLAYDGLYYVKSVTHTIKRGEYKQSFTLARDGLISNIPRVMP